ncbi:PIN domain-containing protein [Rhizobium sp. XQZ8]|uniref:type II toxin-antitoxin system VapC family toxin n=1 Tax=Rhizobium populisoli TaxID=2859785 RepID=UPI001C66DB6C|nr:PIN domain-containing protein [Rhizobium populisoli]MBW6423563.1 PIN domain-containing protein [Rhizobium populisoli]
MEGVDRIYLDTNIFIAAFETNDNLSENLLELVSIATRQSQPRFVTSEMTLAELLVVPFRRNDTRLITLYGRILTTSPWLDVQPATRAIFSTAATLRAAVPSRKLPDAVHLATAILSGCTHLLSSDKGIAPQSHEDISIRVLRPDEPTLTSLLESLAR